MSLIELPRNVQHAVFNSVSRINPRGKEQPTGLGILVRQTRVIGKLLRLQGLSPEEIAKQVQKEIAKLIIQFIATVETSLELTPEQENEIIKQVQAEIIRQAREEIMKRAEEIRRQARKEMMSRTLEQTPEEIEENAISSEQLVLALTEGVVIDHRSAYDLQVLQLNSVIIHLDEILRRLLGSDIELEIKLAPNIGWTSFDLGAITQLIFNLVVNARDAMPDGGHLTIETANISVDEEYAVLHPEVQPGEYVLLTIYDTGCGISDEIKEKIFDPFFTMKKDHTGLGLAVVSSIVNLHGGQIQLYSKVGVGSTFKVYLLRVAKPTPLPNLLEANVGVRKLMQQKLADFGKKL